MKKFISFLLALVIVISQGNFIFANTKEAKLDIASKSAVLMDASTGKVLYEKNPHEKLPPASVTKIMTLLLICEALEDGKIKEEDDVQISENAASMGGSQIFLEPGEIQKVDTLVKSIAVASANDACVAMAEYVGGSMEEFVELMNKRAKELGMNDTNFVNTNGLPVDNHYTSAYDIALMSKELLSHKKISKYLTTWMDDVVVGKKQAKIGISNTNKLVKHYSGATGVKTGFTQQAKYCLSASALRNNTHLIAVTLCAETSPIRFKDATNLLNYGFANYESVKICGAKDKVATVKFEKGEKENVDLVAKDDLSVLIKKGDKKDFQKKVEIKQDLKLPIKKNTELGVVKVYRGKELVGETKIINNEDINKASYLQMLRRIVDNLL
ncbi:MAG: D-alanyl-D-alanine carboxypeptidase family protein [Terrisporobacter othiniensis]|uniref:serine-type D-Ala-D-Ala carboxypeptidase n=1 Tax=Terrisporobacter hibernicus TaxID=2813371 RepID=A0AAX2ZDX4_9FIRM|nr:MULTISPECIES: D-alanyl-D-alanine carboxypeptidase family protein [Terrisporobacter]MBN9646388.1 D-alanyl-D-alanine carboxypeptidase [Terrisporobacter glycolicus]MDU4859663.1 D-alanyl-D-alanine carboxypeptidase family protein [Terrisporobacter othiniensis]MDU6994168.1 D-alanyl-D-alanine carboxypeptidase family protein [Terrisporobacter othiniensis]UEL46945.1 D-alanyl-D-alanine carboxypeptidase [Terrisporobacter hibernicus]SFJ04899.1 D-alanyl-D-alanine carboxypeptidase (penicillin-binding pro